MSTSTIDSILLEASALSAVERYELAMAILDTLREPLGAPKAKRSRKAAASADADGEPKAKRAPTSWNIGCAAVREAIKTVDGYKPPHVMAFAKALKAADDGWATMAHASMVAEYNKWLVDNSDVGSRTSGGSKASKPKAPELTDDEKAAKRKAAAEKRKATLAAKKASAAPAPKAVAAPVADDDSDAESLADDDTPVTMASWEHDFGDGAKMFARYETDGKIYLYETDGETYLGELKGKKKLKIDASTPNPLA